MKEKTKKKLRKIKQVKWLLPGWAGYEYYKVHKKKGYSKTKSVMYGAKAEAIRLGATASFPIPGTYEVTTIGLASLKKQIEKNKGDKLSLKSLKKMKAVKRLKVNKEELITGKKKEGKR